MDPDREVRIARAIFDTERALCARGYTTQQSAAAVKTARKWAWGIAQQLSPQIRDEGYEDLLRRRLDTAYVWIDRSREGMRR